MSLEHEKQHRLAGFTEDEIECPICRETLLDPVGLTCCGNNTCHTCILELTNCPCCRREVNLETSFQRNRLLSKLIENIMGAEWLTVERDTREKRRQEAIRLKQLAKQYDGSLRNDLIKDAFRKIFNPKGTLVDLKTAYKKAATISELFPDNSPFSWEEFLYHVDRYDEKSIRVGDQLLNMNYTRSKLLEIPLRENLLISVPGILRVLSDTPARERFLTLNRELFNLPADQPVVIQKTRKDDFVHLLKEEDLEAKKKIASSPKVGVYKSGAAKAKAAPKAVRSPEDSLSTSTSEE